MKEQLEKIRLSALEALDGVATPAALEELRVKLLGKKGELTAVLKQMGKLSAEERPIMGQLANSVRAQIEEKLESRKADIHAAVLEAKLAAESIDVTIPGKEITIGHQHPMNQVLQQIKDIFVGLGYQVVDGPEVELADYNFTRLNIEEGHPSRDRSDTFYFTDDDSVSAYPDQPHADSLHGDPQASSVYAGSRPGIPEGRSRCHPLPHVPSDRGPGGG